MADDKQMRKIVLLGGDYTGRLGEAAQDYIYVVENVSPTQRPCSSAASCDGTIELIGEYHRGKKFNATGRYEAIGAENFEVYEFAGIEDHSIFIEAQV